MAEAQQGSTRDLPPEAEPTSPAVPPHDTGPENLPSPKVAHGSDLPPTSNAAAKPTDYGAQPPVTPTSSDPVCPTPASPPADLVPADFHQPGTALPLPYQLLIEETREKMRAITLRCNEACEGVSSLVARIRAAGAEIARAEEIRTGKASEVPKRVDEMIGQCETVVDAMRKGLEALVLAEEAVTAQEVLDSVASVERLMEALEAGLTCLEAENARLQALVVTLEIRAGHCRAFTAAVIQNRERPKPSTPLVLCPSPSTGEMPPVEYHKALQSAKKILKLPMEDLHRIAKFYDPTWEPASLPPRFSKKEFACLLCYMVGGRADILPDKGFNWTEMFLTVAPAITSLMWIYVSIKLYMDGPPYQ
ncbi:hypothetical protein IAT38_002771 [Cryptococcus sp. DSM 104549]